MKPNKANILLAGLSLLGIRRGYGERISSVLDLTKTVKVLELLATEPEMADSVPSKIEERVMALLEEHGIRLGISDFIYWGVES
jgi:hypothetical protein